MGGQNSWAINTDAESYLRSIEKRILAVERRPMIHSASDLLGPGAGPYAIAIQDWDEEAATFNGHFISDVGALHTPDGASASRRWIGHVIGTADGSGVQYVQALEEPLFFQPQIWRRAFNTTGDVRHYSQWWCGAESGDAIRTTALSGIAPGSITVIDGLTLNNTIGVTLTSGRKLSVNRPGVWEISYNMQIDGPTGNNFGGAVYKNVDGVASGTPEIISWNQVAGALDMSVSATKMVRLVPSDHIEMFANNPAANTGNLRVVANRAWISLQWRRP